MTQAEIIAALKASIRHIEDDKACKLLPTDGHLARMMELVSKLEEVK